MYKCKICGKKYNELSCLYNHIESKHADMIPQDMTVQQFYYYMKTGKRNGNCVMCKQPTSWNMNTNKYNRFCGNPRCKEEYVKIMKSRMIAKYGKAHLLNDPNKQREMLANRSISGTYEWSDGKHTTTYTGSYELDFLKTLDNFFDWDPTDISMPSPHTYTYEYEGQQKFYIPDVFIHSLDLEIEIKDGGDNPNNHHKIQDVDKVKEKLKDDVLTSQRNFHYVKITNKNYENFFEFLNEVKKGFEKYGDDKKIPRIFKIEDIRTKGDIRPVKESQEVTEEGFAKDVIKGLVNANNQPFRDSDMFLSLRYNMVKDSPSELQSFLKKLIKSAKFEDDLKYVKELAGKSDTYYHNLLKKRPELQDEYDKYYKWIKDDMVNDINKKYKKVKIKETPEYDLEELLTESSISMTQLNLYLQNEYEEEMRHYLATYKEYYQKIQKEKPHAVKHLNEDIKRAIIYIDGLADKGVENNLVQFAREELGSIVEIPKHGKAVKIHESTNTMNVKLLYYSNGRQPFGFNDTKSQFVINENYTIYRDKIGSHCEIKPLPGDEKDKTILEFNIVFNGEINVEEALKNYFETGITINNLFSLRDNEFRFIKEACLKLFGEYPKEINKK